MTKGFDYLGLANSQARALRAPYGQPQSWQNPRNMRFQLRIAF
jgi:hypothetical protein